GLRAYVTAEIGGTVSILDAKRHELIGSVELEGGQGKPVGVIVSPDNSMVYTANGRANTVSIVSASLRKEVGSIRVGRRPWGIALSRDGRTLYSANGLSDDLSIIDGATRRVIATVSVGKRPWGVALVER